MSARLGRPDKPPDNAPGSTANQKKYDGLGWRERRSRPAEMFGDYVLGKHRWRLHKHGLRNLCPAFGASSVLPPPEGVSELHPGNVTCFVADGQSVTDFDGLLTFVTNIGNDASILGSLQHSVTKVGKAACALTAKAQFVTEIDRPVTGMGW
jgi:hypothetical protein